ncbi:MAG: hypothetical protein PHS62_02790 [Patescibacteria group bacterium]|nr:hypothetical protein [Patescibacteria group bacterium]
MIKKLKALLIIGSVLFFIVFFSAEARAAAVAPTLIAPNEKTITAALRPLITGLTKSDTAVKIFIDGIFDGQTGILEDDSGTANFAYRPVKELTRGFHKIQARAEDEAGLISAESNILNFNIELPFPAPTMLTPVVNASTSFNRPYIVGLAKNDSKIKIFIDKKYQGEFTVENHQSGTANFAFKPKLALARGQHAVYAMAIDRRGKESIQSNMVIFFTKNSAIARSAQEERKEAVASIKEPKESVKSSAEAAVISGVSGEVVESAAAPAERAAKSAPDNPEVEPADLNKDERQGEVKDSDGKQSGILGKPQGLIGAGAAEKNGAGGMINESKQNQGRLKLSMIIFILFLVGVVGWLLWVNRELVKEQRARDEAKAKENKDNPPGQAQANKLF